MNPNENGNHPRNDIFAFADKLADDPKYSEGASLLRDMTQALIESGDLPETILIQGEDSEIETVEDPVYHHPLFEHDRNERIVSHSGHTFPLTTLENDLLSLLEDTPNVVVEHASINERIWGYKGLSETILSKGHISRIKSVIPFYDKDGRHEVIGTVAGVGYVFKDSSLKPRVENIIVMNSKEYHDGLVYRHRLFEFHPDEFALKVGEKNISITQLEKRFIECLFRAGGGYVTREHLLTLFKPKDYGNEVPDKDVIKTHMSHIRRKIKDGREIDNVIESKQGVGYRLNP